MKNKAFQLSASGAFDDQEFMFESVEELQKMAEFRCRTLIGITPEHVIVMTPKSYLMIKRDALMLEMLP